MHRITFLGLAFAMTSSETGGYTESFLIFLVMHEPWRGLGRKIALFSCYMLLLPLDVPLDELPIMVIDSYLAGRSVFVTYSVALGHFVRPLFVLMMAVSMSGIVLREVWIDIRDQGWSSRWRYRRDGLRLPGMIAPWQGPLKPAAPAAPTETP